MVTNVDSNGRELPDGWAWTTLGNAFEVVLGQSPPSKTYNTEGIGLPFFQGKAEFGDLYPSPQKWCSEPNKIAEPSDVLISVRAPVGPTNLCKERSCIGRGLAALRPYAQMPSLYPLYFLRFVENDWESKATGTTFSAITGSVLRNQEIPIAPLNEQRRIVEEIETQFSRLDKVVAALERLQANLKRYRASVLKAACEGRLVPTEMELYGRGEVASHPETADVLLERILAERRARWEEEQSEKEIEKAKKKAAQAKRKQAGLPARISDLSEEEWEGLPEADYQGYLPKGDRWKGKYKEPAGPDLEGLPELPEGWCWGTVDQVSTALQYGTSEKANLDENGIPVLRMGNIQDGELDFADLKFLPVECPRLAEFVLEDGDVLFNRTNSAELVGKTAVYKRIHPKAAFASYLIRVKTCSEYSPDFLAFFINSWHGRRYIGSVVSQQVGQANVNGTKLSQMTIPIPPSNEQRRIVEEVEQRLSVAIALGRVVEVNLRRGERLRQAILKRAFEGRLVAQDPEDEPAEVLLERIRERREGRAIRPKMEGPTQLRLPDI